MNAASEDNEQSLQKILVEKRKKTAVERDTRFRKMFEGLKEIFTRGRIKSYRRENM